MNDIALIVDTHSNYSDVWEPCFHRLDRYCNDIKKYAFTDNAYNIPKNIIPITYDNNLSYRDQFLSCIKQVQEKYILYTSEDYILYDYVKLDEIVFGILETLRIYFLQHQKKIQECNMNLWVLKFVDG